MVRIRDHADDRQSAPMLCVDKFVAFTHERLKFLALPNSFSIAVRRPGSTRRDDQTAEHTGDHAQKNRQRATARSGNQTPADARRDNACRKSGQVHIFMKATAETSEISPYWLNS